VDATRDAFARAKPGNPLVILIHVKNSVRGNTQPVGYLGMGNDSRSVPFHKSTARDDKQMTVRTVLDSADHIVWDYRNEVPPIESVQASAGSNPQRSGAA
jgi:hypothetical protein